MLKRWKKKWLTRVLSTQIILEIVAKQRIENRLSFYIISRSAAQKTSADSAICKMHISILHAWCFYMDNSKVRNEPKYWRYTSALKYFCQNPSDFSLVLPLGKKNSRLYITYKIKDIKNMIRFRKLNKWAMPLRWLSAVT